MEFWLFKAQEAPKGRAALGVTYQSRRLGPSSSRLQRARGYEAFCGADGDSFDDGDVFGASKIQSREARL